MSKNKAKTANSKMDFDSLIQCTNNATKAIEKLTKAVAEIAEATGSEKTGGIANKYLQDAKCDKKAIKLAYKKVVEEIGEKEAKALLSAFDANKLKNLDEEHYKDFWASAMEMLDTEEGEEGEEKGKEGEEEGEEEDEIDRDALKAAIQKISSKDKGGASDILNSANLNTVRGIAKASESVLTALFKAVKKYNK